jgi:SAM-dependent methyltransferase
MADPNSGAKSYDEVPYRGKPFKQTHPDGMATIAHLLSLPAPDLQTCRVLELGCCDGGNLLPMAYDLPDAHFVGVDYSSVQINMGRKIAGELGIRNLDLRDISILDIGDDFGEFDYIISHGVFSWVPDAVADKMLDVCAKHLAPDGIAYISYNTYPGWYMRGAVRDMMRYHALRFDTAERRIREARMLLDFVAGSAHGFNAEAYGIALKNEAQMLRNCPDHYLYHEHLEDHSRPYYFHEFVAKAQERGLDFLAESKLGAMAAANYSDAQQRALGAIATNIVELEQFMDFMRNRTFRETLLHRAGRSPVYNIAPGRLEGVYVTGILRAQDSALDIHAGKPATFLGVGNVPVTTSTPIIKAALFCLIRSFPTSLRFESLLEKARFELDRNGVGGAPLAKDQQNLAVGLLKIHTSSDLIEFSIVPSRFIVDAGPKPLASPVARQHAANPEVDYVVTRQHNLVKLDDATRKALALLDGTRDVSALAGETGLAVETVVKCIHQLERSAIIIT